MALNTITRAVLREDLPKVFQAFLNKIKSTFQTLGNLVTAWGSTPSDSKYPSEKLVKTALDGKQDLLLVEVEYGVTTRDEVVAILDAGKVPYLHIPNEHGVYMFGYKENGLYYFSRVSYQYNTSHDEPRIDYAYVDGDDNWYTFTSFLQHKITGNAPDGTATKFLNAAGEWTAPAVVKSLQYWSGGGTSIKGVYIGTCKLQSGWNAWITGTMSATNYHYSDPHASNKGLAVGGFYLWAYRSGSSITARCRFYSMNARHTNTDFFLVYKRDTSDSTTYKVNFYVVFGPRTGGGGTATQARPFGLGINYLENHNADIPDQLTGITDDIPYDDYYSVFKFPYLAQDVAGLGSSTQPVFVDSYGSFAECDEMLLKSGGNATSACANALLSALPSSWTATPTDSTRLIRKDTTGTDTFGQVTFLTIWNYIKSKIFSSAVGNENRPVYASTSGFAVSKPVPNANLMGTVGKTTAANARADTAALVNTTINCNNSSYYYLNAMKFIENVPYTFLIPSVNANKSGLVTSTKLEVFPIGASKFDLGTGAILYLDKAGGSSTVHEIVFAYRVGTALYIFHQY